jgi:pseudouridine kinase
VSAGVTRPRITVVGGANTDIIGLPAGRFALRDSNPGHVRVSPGGVGRNIAENLARLGADVRLVTSFGSDIEARALDQECRRAGIDTSYSLVAEGSPGSRYLAVLDAGGDLAAAVSDMRALAALTPDALDPAAFEGAAAVVLDTNLRASTIARAAELADSALLVLDPVSTAKAPHARPILGRLAALKANLREAEELSGGAGPEGAATRLLEAGVARVFVTMGPDGVWCADGHESFVLPAPRATVVNVTGAGDAFTAGVAWGLATGASLRETAEAASALAAIALESERTVSESISAESLHVRMRESAR